MTMNQAIKMWSSWDGNCVPAAGEIVVDKQTNKIKIGDGITEFADLPYVESASTETTLSEQAKQFIENNIEYLDTNDYETFYSHITTVELAREVSKALFKAGLNPRAHLKKCPKGCESIFYPEGKDDPNAVRQSRWTRPSNRGKTQYQWITTASNSGGKHWSEYIISYDIDKEVEAIKKEIDYLQTWTLEEA